MAARAEPVPAPGPDGAAPADVAALARLLKEAQDAGAGGAGSAGSAPADALFTLLYRELHRLARRELHRNASALTLGATTLLHETYLDLCGRGLDFPDRARFFAYAARAMRGLVVDYVRRRQALKRGGEYQFTSFDSTGTPEAAAAEELGPLSDALDALTRAEPALAELVELKVFCGLSLPEIAAMRGVTERTTQRHWDKARLYLRQALAD